MGGWSCGSTGNRDRDQEVGVYEDRQQPCRYCHSAGKECRHFHHSWIVPYQDTCEASNQSRQAGGLWEGNDGQGEACEDNCKGIPCGCLESQLLRLFSHVFIRPAVCRRFCRAVQLKVVE